MVILVKVCVIRASIYQYSAKWQSSINKFQFGFYLLAIKEKRDLIVETIKSRFENLQFNLLSNNQVAFNFHSRI